jgi:hypothetical protein
MLERLDGTVLEVNQPIANTFELLADPASAEADITVEDLYADPDRATAMMHAEVDGSRIGAATHFVASLESFNIHRQPAILRAVYRRAALAALGRLHQLDGADLHAVRENANADAAQVTRDDGAKLWRCTVTKRGAGYRLDYWALRDGAGIQLDRVVTEGHL